MAKKNAITLDVAGREVRVTSPDKVYFPKAGYTKRDLIDYYLAVAEGALRGVRGRPVVLKRFVDGAAGEAFFQKRAPKSRPDWIETVTLRFPSGRSAEEVVLHDAAQLIWCANLGCLDLNPHPVRASDLEHPDELRIDLDPVPGVPWSQIREVALVTREVLSELDLVGWPKTSGSRGIHINVRLQPQWGFGEVRRAALAIAREVERKAPTLATSAWWKEERHGVFLDYNQNAKDRTVASAYSVRPTEDARVSCPVTWEELNEADPADFTLATVPVRFAEVGDPGAGIDGAPCSLEPVLELMRRHEAEGLGDAPWPPHYEKQPGEAPRVQPSRRRRSAAKPKRTRTSKASEGTEGPAGTVAGEDTAVESPTGRRRSRMPLVVVAKAAGKEEALAGLERWKERHPNAAPHLDDADVLIDAMRGRYKVWYRVRVNLRNVPAENRPPAEVPDPNYDPWSE